MKRTCFILITVFGLLLSNVAAGQMYNPNPFKIEFDNLNIEQTKNEVVTNKIKTIRSKIYHIEKGKLKNEIPQSDFYVVEFNEAGNPVSYHCTDYKSATDPENKEMFDYTFEYDTAGNLIHIQEYEDRAFSPGNHYEKDVYFLYDKNNNLIKQTVARKFIVEPDYPYRDYAIRNDTSFLEFSFRYDDFKRVTTVFRKNYTSRSKQIWLDTLIFNCSFDSVFIKKYVPRGIKKDSEGRMIESTRYSIHALMRGGGCISPDSPTDIITKYYYDDRGKLIKSQSRTRKGKFLNRKRWTYNEKGLLQSIQVEKSYKIIMYEYEFY